MMLKNKFILPVLLLSACALGPKYEQPQSPDNASILSALEAKESENKIAADWYKNFNDTTLNGLIESALKQNFDLQIATSKLRQARYNLRMAQAQYLPTVDGAGAYSYTDPSNNMPRSAVNYYQAGFDAAWELDIWGAGRRLTEAEQALYAASAYSLKYVKLSVISEVANTYVLFRTAQEQLRVAETNLRLQDEIFAIVKQQYAADLADDIALNQAQYAVEQTKSIIPPLQFAMQNYANALNVLLGKLPQTLKLDIDNANLVRQKFAIDVEKLYQLPINAVRNRPDIKQAEMQLVAQNAQVGIALANLFPSVSLSAFLGVQSTNSGNLFGGNSGISTFEPALKMPIFYWGSLINNLRLQKEIKNEYILSYQYALLQATQDIKNAIKNVESEFLRNKALLVSYANSKEILELSLVKYRQGLLSFSDLLTAEQNLLSAQNDLVASNGTIYRNLIAFYKAVGAV